MSNDRMRTEQARRHAATIAALGTALGAMPTELLAADAPAATVATAPAKLVDKHLPAAAAPAPTKLVDKAAPVAAKPAAAAAPNKVLDKVPPSK